MDPKDRKTLRAKIEAALTANDEDIATFTELTKPIAPENAIGRVSRMDAINNKSINDEALRKAEQKKIKLEYALSRIDHPDFGTCTRCKQPIPQGRLLLMPESTRCVNCADR